MISDFQLLELNKRGFIPGPSETEEKFELRVASLESFFENPEKTFINIITTFFACSR